jgi:hypothetical protein
MTLAVKTRFADHLIEQTGYRLYLAMQIGAGIHATGRPYPVRAWVDLPDCDRERFKHRAGLFRSLTEQRLAERLYVSWHGWQGETAHVKPFNRLSLGMRAFWWDIAEAYRQIERDRSAA